MIQRIAVTQRVIDNTTYSERRDGLAQDWADWLGEVFPHAALLAVPNRVDGLDAWFDVVDPEALVLTGGNDWGDAPERDATERRLVARARAARIPMLGVCRGMQALNIVFGGSVVVDLPNLTKVEHVAHDHLVRLIPSPLASLADENEFMVNSYHGQGVTNSGVAEELTIFAEAADGVVEGLFHRDEPIAAIQWHPERQSPCAGFDRALATALFERGAFWTGAT